MPPSESRRTIYQVTELNGTIRRLLEAEFPLIWVEGEISNFSQPASGHYYFSLKDEKSQVSCAMFKNRNQLLRFQPENGMKVLIRARVSLYEARGSFQLIAEHMEDAGEGALQRAYEELRAKLAKEGLFDLDRKRALPELPTCIGVITSVTGAAIRDVLQVLKRRAPGIPVRVYPAQVQGEGAVPQLLRALRLANQEQQCDVLLLVRGGGSLEDLWSFNDEQLAHAIVASEIPIICGVGHEVDITIADYAADVRAPTPSAAAEVASPDTQQLAYAMTAYSQQLTRLMQERLRYLREKLGWLEQRLKLLHPQTRIQQQYQRLDELRQRLSYAMQHLLTYEQQQTNHLIARLVVLSPQYTLRQHHQTLQQLGQRLGQASQRYLRQRHNQLESLARTLHAVSPLNTLARGYSITTTLDGDTVSDCAQVQVGDNIRIRLQRGQLTATVKKSDQG